MDRKSMQDLRMDRRLLGRRGWISPAELERELEALPDVSDKVAVDPEAMSQATANDEPSK